MDRRRALVDLSRCCRVHGRWRTGLKICPFGYGWCAARFPRSVAGVAAEEVGGARGIDGDGFGGGRDGKDERVREEGGRGKEEAGSGGYQQAGNGGWLRGVRSCRGGGGAGRGDSSRPPRCASRASARAVAPRAGSE